MEHKRLFVAVNLSSEALQALGRLQDAGREAESFKEVRWLPPENLHVTLHFLGDTAAEELAAIESALQAAATAEPFHCRLAHVGCFPHPKKPRVLWAGFDEGSEELTALAEKVSSALVSAGCPAPDKPFRAHVTIGYIRKQTAPSAAKRIFSHLAESAPDALGGGKYSHVGEYSLVESKLSSAGAEHVPLFTVRLRNA